MSPATLKRPSAVTASFRFGSLGERWHRVRSHPVRVPAGLLRGGGSGVQGDVGASGRLCETGPNVPRQPFGDLAAGNATAAEWCAEVNAAQHAEIAAVPADRLETEQPLLRPLSSLRPEI
jgi:hypothetical protein